MYCAQHNCISLALVTTPSALVSHCKRAGISDIIQDRHRPNGHRPSGPCNAVRCQDSERSPPVDLESIQEIRNLDDQAGHGSSKRKKTRGREFVPGGAPGNTNPRQHGATGQHPPPRAIAPSRASSCFVLSAWAVGWDPRRCSQTPIANKVWTKLGDRDSLLTSYILFSFLLLFYRRLGRNVIIS